MTSGPDDQAPAVPTWVKVVGALTIALILLFAGMALFGGGEHGPGRHAPAQSDPAGPDAGSGGDASGACRTQPFEHGGGSGAELTCEGAEGPGRIAEGFRCENPDHGGLEAEWDLSAGEVTVTVRGAAGTTVFSETYQGQGSGSASFPESEPGSWETEAVRGDGFAGSFTVQIFCSN